MQEETLRWNGKGGRGSTGRRLPASPAAIPSMPASIAVVKTTRLFLGNHAVMAPANI